MKTWVRKSFSVGVLAAGGLLVSQAAAHADIISSDNFGIGNGLQVIAPVQTVTNVCGNATPAAGGVAFAACDGGASANNSAFGSGDLVSTGNFGIGNGLQTYTPLQTVTNTCGLATSAAASVAYAGCDGGADASIGDDENGRPSGDYAARASQTADENSKAKGPWRDAATNIVSSGNYGIGNGLQVYAPVQTAINLCGNSIPAIGGVAFASCDGGASADIESAHNGGGDLYSGWNFGTGNGVQTYTPIQTVTNTCGLATPAAGAVAFASCDDGASANIESGGRHGGGGTNIITAGNFGLANGVQTYAPLQILTTACGNSTSAGAGVAFASCDGGASADIESAREENLPLVGELPVLAGLPVVGGLGGQQAAPRPANEGDQRQYRGNSDDDAGWHGDDHQHGKDHHGRGGNRHDGGPGGTNIVSAGNFGIGNGLQTYAPLQNVVNTSGLATSAAGGVAFASSDGGADAEL